MWKNYAINKMAPHPLQTDAKPVKNRAFRGFKWITRIIGSH